MENVVITGYGIACPLGMGGEAVARAVAGSQSGVRAIPAMADAGWPAPLGGVIQDGDFDPKEWVKPRKSLKVMAREIQLAFACGEQAWDAAGLQDTAIDPERMGVVCGAGLMYCDPSELEASYRACMPEGGFEFDLWGQAGMRELYPLWMLKYLPNMSASHLGIRRDARGPTNSIAHGDASSLLALSEAAGIIRRGGADVMLTGGSSSRLHLVDPLWPEGARAWRSGVDPAEACRPFDADRTGSICGEGAAVLVLESESHARRRGARPLARVASVVCRSEDSTPTHKPTGRAIEQSIAGALERSGVTREELAFVKAHAGGARRGDAIEARAIRNTLGDIPVTAPKSYFGNCGAAGGAVELTLAVMALAGGQTPSTLNYQTPDPECPVNVVTAPQPLSGEAVLALNHNLAGQSVAAVLQRSEAEPGGLSLRAT